MTTYQVTLSDRTVEHVEGADAYQQEGQMTTFFATRRQVIDSWSTRLASYRTSEILSVRRVQGEDGKRSTHMGSKTSPASAVTTVWAGRAVANTSRSSSHCDS